MSAIKFLTTEQVKAIHERQIIMFGGSAGILDKGKLESAVFRPQNTHYYNPDANLYDLAASLGWGIANNHPFVDGNKRTALITMAVFLKINQIELIASEPDVVNTMLAVAAAELSEQQLSEWLENNTNN